VSGYRCLFRLCNASPLELPEQSAPFDLCGIVEEHKLKRLLLAVVWIALPLICLSAAFAAGGSFADTAPAIARQITIASGPVQKALSEFARATDIEILVDPTLTAGKITAGVNGVYTPRDGLRALLAGCGLDFDWQDGSARLRRGETMPAISTPPKVPLGQ